MSTPSRSARFPQSSPSSARLRRLAPSPVKIPPLTYFVSTSDQIVRTPTSFDVYGSSDQRVSPVVLDSISPGVYRLAHQGSTSILSTQESHTAARQSKRSGGRFIMINSSSSHSTPPMADPAGEHSAGVNATTPFTPQDDADIIPVIFDFAAAAAAAPLRPSAPPVAVAFASLAANGQRQHESGGDSGSTYERHAANEREGKKIECTSTAATIGQSPDVPESIRVSSSSRQVQRTEDRLGLKCGSSSRDPEGSVHAPAGPSADQRVLLTSRSDPSQYRHEMLQIGDFDNDSKEVLLNKEDAPLLHPAVSKSAHRLLPSFSVSTIVPEPGRFITMSHTSTVRDEREISIAESFHTFGPSGRRPSAVSIEGEDGWSYSLSAYGDHDDEDPTPTAGPSRKSSSDTAMSRDSLTSFGIPDFVHFIPPMPIASGQDREYGSESTTELHTPRMNDPFAGPDQMYATVKGINAPLSPSQWMDRSGLFKPNYSIGPVPRPSISSDGCNSESSTPRQHLYSQSKTSCESSDSSRRPLLSVNTINDYVYDEPSPRTRTRSGTLSSLQDAVDGRHTPGPLDPIVPANNSSSSTLSVPGSSGSSASSTKSADRRSRASSTGSDQNIPSHVADALKSIDKSSTLKLIVDQEGAREVQTVLKYMKIHKPQVWRDRELKALEEAALWSETPTRPEPFQTTGCIEFGMDPKARAKWAFHHATLEGLPVLRRVILGDQENYDYISRSATLQIRDSGVYAVYGSEDKGKVEWKFEYMVQPKFSRTTGEPISGEKIVVPLGFYVSPSFFNPDRATKLHLLNVFKKQFTPNVVSEKVKPPHIGTPPKQETLHAPLTPTSSQHSASSTGGGFTRALAKVKSSRSRTTTPTESQPFGDRDMNRSRSRSRPPTSEGYTTLDDDEVVSAVPKKPLRRRATSLFGRSRPFTPPANITEQHPVPPLHTMRSVASLRSSRRPHTAQATIRGEVPPPPPYTRHDTSPTAAPLRPSRPSTANARVPPVPRLTPFAHNSQACKPLPALPPTVRSHLGQRPATSNSSYPTTPRKNDRPSTAISSTDTTPIGVRLVTPGSGRQAINGIYTSPIDRNANTKRGWRNDWDRLSSEESVSGPGMSVGVSPAPRKVVKVRPSTAQPRLGVAL